MLSLGYQLKNYNFLLENCKLLRDQLKLVTSLGKKFKLVTCTLTNIFFQ